MTPSGDINKNTTELVIEWQTNAECTSVPQSVSRAACSRSSQYEHFAEEVCQQLKEGKNMVTCAWYSVSRAAIINIIIPIYVTNQIVLYGLAYNGFLVLCKKCVY